MLDSGGKITTVEPHVAIEETEISALAVLISKLGACAAGAVLDVAQSDDLDRVSARYLDRPVGRCGISEDNLSVQSFERCERALDRSRNMTLFVERLDDDADGQLSLFHKSNNSTVHLIVA